MIAIANIIITIITPIVPINCTVPIVYYLLSGDSITT